MLRTVELILPASESYLPGDFVVYRALPRRELRRVGGFAFLDHFDQPDITPELFDVPPHPHIGLQTVTYLFDGEILHTDSLGNQCEIRPGDVNWMTAGRGITHAEQVTRLQPRVHGLQSWVGLPHDVRKTDPAFDHFPQDLLPKIRKSGFKITVIAGDCLGEASPIPTFQKLVYLDIQAAPGVLVQFPVDPTYELAIYVCEGSVNVGERVINRNELAKLSKGDLMEVSCETAVRFVVIGGEPLPDPTVIYWNFITDTVGEAKQAAIDWEDGKFPVVDKYKKYTSADLGDEEERMQLL
jgi:redox-sensitive bicupin YhaK (pirin superfamily)